MLAVPYLSIWYRYWILLVPVVAAPRRTYARTRRFGQREHRCLPPVYCCVRQSKQGALREGRFQSSCVLPTLGKGAERMPEAPHRDGLGGER
jgi:hypothetical protein